MAPEFYLKMAEAEVVLLRWVALKPECSCAFIHSLFLIILSAVAVAGVGYGSRSEPVGVSQS